MVDQALQPGLDPDVDGNRPEEEPQSIPAGFDVIAHVDPFLVDPQTQRCRSWCFPVRMQWHGDEYKFPCQRVEHRGPVWTLYVAKVLVTVGISPLS